MQIPNCSRLSPAWHKFQILAKFCKSEFYDATLCCWQVQLRYKTKQRFEGDTGEQMRTEWLDQVHILGKGYLLLVDYLRLRFVKKIMRLSILLKGMF